MLVSIYLNTGEEVQCYVGCSCISGTIDVDWTANNSTTCLKMKEISHIIFRKMLSFFPNAQIKDILFAGSLCGYCYDDLSDVDIFIVIDDIASDKDIETLLLQKINVLLSVISWKPVISN